MQSLAARIVAACFAVCMLSLGSANVDSLLQVAGEVDKAFGTLVNIMTDDENSEDETSHQMKSFRH